MQKLQNRRPPKNSSKIISFLQRLMKLDDRVRKFLGKVRVVKIWILGAMSLLLLVPRHTGARPFKSGWARLGDPKYEETSS